MKLLDTFCKAGGAGMGYHLAGFEVVGVDIEPQPNYPFEFIQADAIEFIREYGHEFDAIHASPPCQDHMRGGNHPVHGTGYLLGATRSMLIEIGTPWVIENVPGAPIRADYRLCGCMFGLRIDIGQLVRERWFETSWHGFTLIPPHYHIGPAISVVGHGTTSYARNKIGRCPTIAEYRQIMDIDWMTRGELSQAIPPAYTKFIGEYLMKELTR